ncbi:MAG: trypsin-like peptidase domain-containing protein [Thermoleophilia bacterium]|nr:trypsin-like peptidase domain-containing protein [Thermoleophilia bacterium]
MSVSPSPRAMRGPKAWAAAIAVGVVCTAAPAAGLGAPTQAQLERGIVDIEVSESGGGAAAGTGIVVGTDGVILTNNHVVKGSTRIRVRDVRTNRRWSAEVLGYDVTGDVAVLRITKRGVSIRTARLGNSAKVRVGDPVIAVGNANGSGGRAEVSHGVVSRLNRSINVEGALGEMERLTGVIQTTTPLAPGESGGPLYNAAGRVVGMTAAASFTVARGFAIPINRALAVVRQVRSGKDSATVHIGPTAFLGVRLVTGVSGGDGAVLAGVLAGSPAAEAGLRAGDTVTALDGTRVASGAGLAGLIGRHRPGDVVTVTWTDQTGATRSARVTLTTGPTA